MSEPLPEAAFGLLDLLSDEGYGEDLGEFLDEYGVADIVPGICWGCGNIERVEPDQQRGWCGACKRNSIRSALILAGVL